MKTIYDRTQMLLGVDAVKTLMQKAVIVFGVGGVGGFAVEALARTGVGSISIVDCDCVDITNINRQIIAEQGSVGRMKVDAMKDRIAAINGSIRVKSFEERLTAENIEGFCLDEYDYIIDAIDDVPAKLALIEAAVKHEIPIICSMGTGNKLDPQRLRIVPIEKTHTCPLAKVIRKELSKRGIKRVNVVFSDEIPAREQCFDQSGRVPASAIFVPACAGMLLASKVVVDLCPKKQPLHP